MRILLVTHDYSPLPSPRAFRWTALAEDFVQRHGAEVDVITRAVAGSAAFEVKGGVRLFRVGRALSGGSGTSAPPSSWKALLRGLWRMLRWPDYAGPWYFPATRQAKKLLTEKEYDYLISVSHPFTGHLVGLRIQRWRPRLKWMIDIGDPFAFLEEPPANNTKLYRTLNYWIERKILARADRISVTTTQTALRYIQLFALAQEKITVIPPLLAVIPRATAMTSSGGCKKLVYFGTLYREIRSPEPVLRLFRALVERFPQIEAELHFYGAVNDCADLFSGKSDRVFVHGLVSRDEVERLRTQADILIHLGNKTNLQLPSKTVEYMASGKPIVNFVNSVEDTSSEIFARYPALMTVLVRSENSSQVVQDFAKFIAESSPLPQNRVLDAIAPFTIEKVSGEYWRLLA